MRERALADEYLSVEALWAFTGMARALEEIVHEAVSAEVLLATVLAGATAFLLQAALLRVRSTPAPQG